MSSNQLYPICESFLDHTNLNFAEYRQLYEQSINNPSQFWETQGKRFIDWIKPWNNVFRGDFDSLDVQWFSGGQLNASYNCIDRHLTSKRDKVAIIWEGNEPTQTQIITYGELHKAVCAFANALKQLGVKKGDRVSIYLPMIPEAAIAMLACSRIGAIHSVVFAGFSPESLKTRILDADCSLVITADAGVRGAKIVPLKENVDKALYACPNVKQVVVVRRSGQSIPWVKGRDHWYHDIVAREAHECNVEPMDAADPLFILYTSGSTGKPKGVLHGTGGYLVYTAMSFHYVFDHQPDDIFWCTADVGWITGHSYLIYGPLLNGATTVLYEGVPGYPTFSRYWEIIDKHLVNIFYTAPTAIRALRREGDDWVKQTKRNSLRLLGTVGEPINPDVWRWYYNVVGQSRCPIVDTWWQTETGGILLSPLPGATSLKPGSVGWPLFGIEPLIVNEQGNLVKRGDAGSLVIKKPWPGMMQTIYGNHQRFIEAYFKVIPGYYYTGDGAVCDDDGYFSIIGRNDDVIKVSGHRIGSGELESALLTHHAVSEAAVVGVPNELTGEGIYAFVTTISGIHPSDNLKQELIQKVRDEIGAIAKPDVIQWAKALPRTRSGKIMRRILRNIACQAFDELGDTTTLSEPSVVEELIEDRKRDHCSNL